MTALTAFELLIKCERARFLGDHNMSAKNEAIDAVRKELTRCIVEILTPTKENVSDGAPDA